MYKKLLLIFPCVFIMFGLFVIKKGSGSLDVFANEYFGNTIFLPLIQQSSSEKTIKVDFGEYIDDHDLQLVIQRALTDRSSSTLQGSQFIITSKKRYDDWAIFSIASLDGISCQLDYLGAGVQCGDMILAHYRDLNWAAAVRGTASFEDLLLLAPVELISDRAKSFLTMTSVNSASMRSSELKFPWPSGKEWHYTQGWHEGNAVDIAPSHGDDRRTLSAADGVITFICRNGTGTYNVKIQHAGVVLDYFHLDKDEVEYYNQLAESQAIVQGKVLGKLRVGSFAWDGCGRATQTYAHLHWIIPKDGTFAVEGWLINPTSGIWYKNGQGKGVGNTLLSSNLPVEGNDPPPPTRPTDTPVPTGQAKLYNQANFGGSVVWSGNAGFNNDPNANSYSLELPSGWSAKTWRGDNRSGEERCWSGSINNLQDHGWQNAIQSIEIFTSNACPTVTPTFTPTNTPRPPTPTATPIPQSCTNPPPDRNVAYLFENENCVNPWNWSSGHPSDGANRNAKSAWMPSGKVLLLSERNDGGEPRICLSSPVRNLADIGWGNRVEWAEMRDGCPVVQPTATPAGPKHEAKFYEEPNFANQVFTLNNPGTYRYSDLGYVDQFRKFYSVDLCSGCSIQLTNKRGDSICWGWDENNIGDHGDWPLVTVQIKFSYQNECPPREPSLQSPEEGAQFWEGDSVYVVWKDNDDPTSMYFTTEVRYGGTTIAQKYRTTERSLAVTNLAPGSYTIQSQSCSDLMCSSWKTRSFQVRVNPTATPTWTPTATDTATTRPTTTPTFTATPSPQPITTATATVTFPTRSAIPSVISPQSELVVGIGEAVTFRWQPLSYPVEYLIYVNRNGVRIADSGGLRSNTWAYTFTTPGTYEWTISSLCLGCTEYFSGFSQTYLVYAGGAPTATPTEIPAPSPTSTATPTREPDCSISIEQGALFTGQPTVRIHAAVPNAVEVQFSNDGGFTGAFWQPYANELTWTLSDPGQKIVTLLVYARFRDTAGRPLCGSTPLSDDIIYDPLPPTVRIESFTPPAYANAATESASTPGLLTVFAEDQVGGSGVTAMRVGYQADLSTLPWVPFTAVTQVTELAGKTIFVEVHDAVGNQSATASWPVNSGSLLYLPLIKR